MEDKPIVKPQAAADLITNFSYAYNENTFILSLWCKTNDDCSELHEYLFNEVSHDPLVEIIDNVIYLKGKGIVEIICDKEEYMMTMKHLMDNKDTIKINYRFTTPLEDAIVIPDTEIFLQAHVADK